MLRVAHGGANWILAPLTLAILMVGFARTLGAPWMVPMSAVPFFGAMTMTWFFRDPERRAPADAAVVSPADGKVVRVDKVTDPELGRCDRVAVFMSFWDVHVNRMPFDGDVRRITHRPGGHVPAFRKDSDRNERVETLVQTRWGDAKVVQIAGAVARRIVPYVVAGEHVPKGDRLGLIRLGSRCDVLIPEGRVAWTVQRGDRVRAGRSAIGEEDPIRRRLAG